MNNALVSINIDKALLPEDESTPPQLCFDL